MEEQYTTNIQFPIEYQSFPENKILKDSLPPAAELNVEAEGWQLIKLQLNKSPYPLVVDLSSVKAGQAIPLKEASFFKAGKVPNQIQVRDVSPDSLNIVFDQAARKRVPVKLNGQFSYAAQHNLADSIRILPQAVTVSGPKTYVTAIQQVPTKAFEYTGIDQKLAKDVPLKDPQQAFVTYSREKVKVMVPVEELTEKSLEVPIYFSNPYYRNRITLIPTTVSLRFQAPLSRYRQIQPSDFRLEVKAQLTDQKAPPDRLSVEVAQKPYFIYRLRLQPKAVDYLKVKTPPGSPQ